MVINGLPQFTDIKPLCTTCDQDPCCKCCHMDPVEIGEWISVKDRLPEKNDIYVVFGRGNRTIEAAYFSHYDIEPEWDTEYVHKITHWMPLPPTPKGD